MLNGAGRDPGRGQAWQQGDDALAAGFFRFTPVVLYSSPLRFVLVAWCRTELLSEPRSVLG